MRVLMPAVLFIALFSFGDRRKASPQSQNWLPQSQSWDSLGIAAIDISAKDTGTPAPIYLPSSAKVVEFSCVPKMTSVSGGTVLTLITTCYILEREPSSKGPN